MIISEISPVLITCILGSIDLINSVGSNSSGDGWILIINFWFKPVTIFEIPLIVSIFLTIDSTVKSKISSVVGPEVANKT